MAVIQLHKFTNIIKNKSGASMAFVLAVMLLLMAVGISVITSASSNISADINKQIATQLNIYADSIQKSIMFSLQTSGGDEGLSISSPKTLGGQILSVAYKKALIVSQDPAGSFTLDITPELSNSTDLTNVISNITINVTPVVSITPAVPEQMEVTDDEGNIIFPYELRKPQTAAASGAVTVTVMAKYGKKAVTSMVTYEFYGGLLADDGVNPDNMIISDAGIWRFISYEKTDR